MSSPINNSSVSVLIFVEDNASFVSVVQAIFSLLVGITSESECLCPTLDMFCDRLDVTPPPASLRIVDHLVSGVLMAVAVGIVYG